VGTQTIGQCDMDDVAHSDDAPDNFFAATLHK
jgi:hypothetical protein